MSRRAMYIALAAAVVVIAFVAGRFLDRVPEAEPDAAEAETGSGYVNVYTSRHYGIEPVFEQFTEDTGIEVRFTTGADALLRERLKAEGENTLADMFIAVDAGNLWLAAEEGLLASVESQTLTENIPQEMRDTDGRWFGLTQRVRTIMYHPDRVSPEELSTYEALADPAWQGRLAMRPSTHAYTQSLVSSLIAAHGESRAEEIVSGWVGNAPSFIDSDTDILKALAAGEADVAITNHYYLGRLLEEDPDFPVRVFWANQEDRGAHANISGAGITAHAPNRENALALLEWLSGPGQELFAGSNHEFPANPAAAAHPIIVELGEFSVDPLAKSEYGRLQADAIKLMNRAGYE